MKKYFEGIAYASAIIGSVLAFTFPVVGSVMVIVPLVIVGIQEKKQIKKEQDNESI